MSLPSFTPVYTSDSPSCRKVHISIEKGPTLCGAEKRCPWLTFDHGDPIEDDIGDYVSGDSADFACSLCLAAVRAIINQEEAK